MRRRPKVRKSWAEAINDHAALIRNERADPEGDASEDAALAHAVEQDARDKDGASGSSRDRLASDSQAWLTSRADRILCLVLACLTFAAVFPNRAPPASVFVALVGLAVVAFRAVASSSQKSAGKR